MSNPGSWGKSWLNSWLNSWGRQEETGRSGWFRLWLAKAQEQANNARETPSKFKRAMPEVAQGAVEVPKILARSAKKTRKVEKVIAVPEEFHLPPFVLHAVPKTVQLLEQPLPDYSVSEFTKALDFQHHQEARRKKRQREEETLILLLAA